jgi:hypothetical protein
MVKQLIIKADNAEKLDFALKILQNLNGIEVSEAKPTLPKKQLSEAERAKLWAVIEKGIPNFDLNSALANLADSKKDKPLPFRD